MSMSVRFNQPVDGGAARRDPMRVLTHAGFQWNDLSPEVLFSGLWPCMLYDQVSWRLDMNAQADILWQPSWASTRQFGTYPNVHAALFRDDGIIVYPFVRSLNNRPTQTSTTYSLDGMARFTVDVVHRGGNMFNANCTIQQINYREFASGVLRMFLIGRGLY
ncbi:hypothetical protein J2X36_000833 [Methylobacterium sp. BE186]|uniref:hypothetical protein n=1 Tax=Methylobacterium sp. BE186 TaxID=2817715 RepID=UPI0028556619|nr:hypothetical protein [Methylobacterium sp. BE186]MDR7036097.1 hypothetical protein [Methylobacterium sp. BE186]